MRIGPWVICDCPIIYILWCWEKQEKSMLLRCYSVSLGHLINTYTWPPSKCWYPTCLSVDKTYKHRTLGSSATLLQDPRTSVETNIVITQSIWLVITEYSSTSSYMALQLLYRVLAFSTNSFHLLLSWARVFQFGTFIFCIWVEISPYIILSMLLFVILML